MSDDNDKGELDEIESDLRSENAEEDRPSDEATQDDSNDEAWFAADGDLKSVRYHDEDDDIPPIPTERFGKWSPLALSFLSFVCDPFLYVTYLTCKRASDDLKALKGREAVGHWDSRHASVRNQAVWAIMITIGYKAVYGAVVVGSLFVGASAASWTSPALGFEPIPSREEDQIFERIENAENPEERLLAFEHLKEVEPSGRRVDELLGSGVAMLGWTPEEQRQLFLAATRVQLNVETAFQPGAEQPLLIQAWLDYLTQASLLRAEHLSAHPGYLPSAVMVARLPPTTAVMLPAVSAHLASGHDPASALLIAEVYCRRDSDLDWFADNRDLILEHAAGGQPSALNLLGCVDDRRVREYEDELLSRELAFPLFKNPRFSERARAQARREFPLERLAEAPSPILSSELAGRDWPARVSDTANWTANESEWDGLVSLYSQAAAALGRYCALSANSDSILLCSSGPWFLKFELGRSYPSLELSSTRIENLYGNGVQEELTDDDVQRLIEELQLAGEQQ